MAQRRMIDKVVVNTHSFLKLPLETQALYFHLMLNADDDGIVEAFPVVRMIGASDDSLGLLVVKKFIKSLNDEMVFFIVDFEAQNTLRKERVKPSKYRHLLNCQIIDGQLSDKRQTNDGQVADNRLTNVGIDKDRIDKDRLGKDSIDKKRQEKVFDFSDTDFQAYLQYFIDFGGMSKARQNQAMQEWLKLIPEQRKQAAIGAKHYISWYQETGNDVKFLVNAASFLSKMMFMDYQESVKASKSKKQVKTAPEWSNTDYENETTTEQKAELEEMQKKALEKLRD